MKQVQAALRYVQVYKGVVPPGEFSGMVDELIAGPCIAVEVRQHGCLTARSQQQGGAGRVKHWLELAY